MTPKTDILRMGAVILLLLAMSPNVARAGERLLVPEESGSGPFYARIERGLIHHTDEWAAIAFYRLPTCVPAGFNLLDFFDFTFAAFGCPLTVEGFEVWKNGPPPVDLAPIQSKLRGLGAVPVWFVSWPELQGAIADNVLTKSELLAMTSLRMGTATYFKETLHPFGGAKQSMLEIVAHGSLPDGQSFQYQATEAAGVLREVRIEFK